MLRSCFLHANFAIVATFLPQEYHIETERSLPTYLPSTNDYEQEQKIGRPYDVTRAG